MIHLLELIPVPMSVSIHLLQRRDEKTSDLERKVCPAVLCWLCQGVAVSPRAVTTARHSPFLSDGSYRCSH